MTWIQTYTGREFHPLSPRADDVCLEDIAHALSMLCRFSGHTREFYSVAQHSVLVARAVIRRSFCCKEHVGFRHRAAGLALLHDAHEAYFTDVASPLKDHLNIEAVEEPIQDAIHLHFGLEPSDSIAEVIKQEDMKALATEVRDLMAPPPRAWRTLPPPWDGPIKPWPPEQAETEFLRAAGYYRVWRNRAG